MFDPAQTGLQPAREIARTTSLSTAVNGLRWASYGFTEIPSDSLLHIVEAVPPAVAASLRRRAYYFVPLAIGEMGEAGETEIAAGYTVDLAERATCHRNVLNDGVESTFISARLMQDRFALAFEFFINIGHQFVDSAPVPQRFQDLVWSQAKADVRGETSQEAWEARKRALDQAAMTPNSTFAATLHAAEGITPMRGQQSREEAAAPHMAQHPEPLEIGGGSSLQSIVTTAAGSFSDRDGRMGINNIGERDALASGSETWSGESRNQAGERHATAYFEAAFADTLAIYMLSLSMDLDYADLREREYPLLTAASLADRLRLAAELFPPSPNYEFAIKYRRRH